MREHASRSLAFKITLGVLIAIGFLASCNKSDHPPLPGNDLTANQPPPAGSTCVDNDHDGYGQGCIAGPDCDDTNASITNQCYRCATPNDGCPCTTEGQVVACGSEASREGNRVTCVDGDRTCTGGVWAACVAKTVTTMDLSAGSLVPLAVATNPAVCAANVCDPFCHHFDNSTPPAIDSNTVLDGGVSLVNSAGGSSGTGGTGAGGSSVCSNVTENATRYPIGVVTTVQLSTSKSAEVTTVKSALKSFFTSSSVTGMTMGFDEYPCPSCTKTSGCGGTDMCCATNYDDTSGGVTATKPPNYMVVQMGMMPGTANAQQTKMTTAVTALTTSSNVPMLAALSGALDAAQAWGELPANLAAGAKPVVVLVADQLPNVCGVCGGKSKKSAKNQAACYVQAVAQIAEQYYYDATLPVTTLVVGVSDTGAANLKYLDTIARAGSGGKYGVFTADATGGTTTALVAALNAIRTDSLTCNYPVPLPPSGTGVIDPATTKVTLSGVNIPRVTALGDCGNKDGFFYDATVPQVTLCPTTCTTAENNLTANIQVTYSCDSSCSSQSAEAVSGPLDVLFLMDRTSGMANDLTDSSGNDVGVTAWSAAETAVRNFVRDPDVAGLEVGLSYYPIVSDCYTCEYGSLFSGYNLSYWPFCNKTLTSGTYGDCVDNGSSPSVPATGDDDSEYFADEEGTTECTSSDYYPTYGLATPTGLGATQGVDFNVIPGSGSTPFWETLFDSMDRTVPDSSSSSPSTIALTGALAYAESHQTANPTHKTVVVFVSSGITSTRQTTNCNTTKLACSGVTIKSTALAATIKSDMVAELQCIAAKGHSAGVDTYVMGIGNAVTAANMNLIQSSGTGAAYPTAFTITDASDPSAFINAMLSIRRQAMNCNFDIPTPSSGTLDTTPANVSVHLSATVSPATSESDYTLTNVTGSSACSGQNWYYDSNTTPTLINLCTTPCTNLRNDLNSRVDITYQCVVPTPPPPPTPSYSAGTATFEFDADGVCAADQLPSWEDFSYQSTTPGNSSITFTVATGTRDSSGNITNLTSDVPLQFTKTSLSGDHACAAAWTSGPADACGYSEDTEIMGPQFGALRSGDILVDTTLQANSLSRNLNYLRIKATLNPSSDGTQTPKISNWDLQISCVTSQ